MIERNRIAPTRRGSLGIMFLPIWVMAFTLCASSQPNPGATPLSDRIVAYTIAARLDPAAKRIEGRETLRWRNPSTDVVRELQFHLYLNAFRDDKSTYMKESGGQFRGVEARGDKFGAIDLTEMKLSDGTNLLPGSEFIHPDDDNADDRTVLRVPLPRPVAPGESVTLDIGFTAKLPRSFDRCGYFGDYFLVAQWFPKIGVYEPAGRRGRATGGWNCHQFHATSEFYADFGNYDVTVTVPDRFVIGATGVLAGRERRPNGETAYRYVQDDVHDFAWTASPDYVVAKDVFSEPGLPTVEITALMQPYHVAQTPRHIAAAKAALRFFGRNFGPYPYATLTIVDPAHNAEGSGGMEYPTFITAGTEDAAADDSALVQGPEAVTVHEFGHQYWYGMVASNEAEESWLDEGINSYCENLVMENAYADRNAVWFPFAGRYWFRLPVRATAWDNTTIQLSANAVKRDPIVTPAWKYSTEGSYWFNSYGRPALTLGMLERYVGRDKMMLILRTYFERWRFRHPTSRDFFAVASEVAGENLDWFFNQYFLGTAVLDYAVESVASGNGNSAATVVRLGDAVMPVEIEFRFADGSRRRESWDGRDAARTFSLVSPAPVVAVIVDPDGKLMLDVNRFNNSRSTYLDKTGAVGLLSRLTYGIQQALQVVSFFS